MPPFDICYLCFNRPFFIRRFCREVTSPLHLREISRNLPQVSWWTSSCPVHTKFFSFKERNLSRNFFSRSPSYSKEQAVHGQHHPTTHRATKVGGGGRHVRNQGTSSRLFNRLDTLNLSELPSLGMSQQIKTKTYALSLFRRRRKNWAACGIIHPEDVNGMIFIEAQKWKCHGTWYHELFSQE